MQKLFLVIIVASFFFSCTKKETEEVLIPGNKALPDTTTSTLLSENYVNKVYISLLGRKPTANELSTGAGLLAQNNFSEADRALFLEDVISRPDYFPHSFSIARVDLLNDMDTTEFANYIFIFNILLADSTYISVWDQLQFEIDRLEDMTSLSAALNAGTLDEKGMHRRCVNNYFYDQINMGTENFVVSLWQHFLFRYPTDNERVEAGKMVDGLNGIVFLKDGYSKNNLLDIFFGSDEYYEGQVRDLYTRYLFRQPSSLEMAELSLQYKTSGNYKELQKSILKLNEYAGKK